MINDLIYIIPVLSMEDNNGVITDHTWSNH